MLRLVDMKAQIDGAISQLVLDLEERGLLNRTLIVLASEFSRDALIEGKPDKTVKDQVEVPDAIQSEKHYGMHRHFTDAGSVLLLVAGSVRYLHGITADERPCKTWKARCDRRPPRLDVPGLGGSPPSRLWEIEQRPFYVTRDGPRPSRSPIYSDEVSERQASMSISKQP
ncbi:MAG: DUF1501 domain-containing protein [Verrucomicrobiota bacterium]